MSACILTPTAYFPADPAQRRIARRAVRRHRETAHHQPARPYRSGLVCHRRAFRGRGQSLLLWPDHYLLRLLYSAGVTLESIGLAPQRRQRRRGRNRPAQDLAALSPITITSSAARPAAPGWTTPSWKCSAWTAAFGPRRRRLLLRRHQREAGAAGLPAPRLVRALQYRGDRHHRTFRWIELKHHEAIAASGWKGRVVTTFRPDEVTDPDHDQFAASLKRIGELTGEDSDELERLSARASRTAAPFSAPMAPPPPITAIATAQTADLSPAEAEALFARVTGGKADAQERELFRAQMLTEMARMSVEDGMVMQIHPGCWRNHNAELLSPLRPQYRRRHAGAGRLHGPAEAAAGPLRQRRATSPWCCSPWTRPPMRANWRRWPGIIPA